MIGPGCTLAQQGHYTSAVSSMAAFVLINLCISLPIVIIVWYLHAVPFESPEQWINAIKAVESDRPLIFPLIVWRVDTILLMVLGMALIPMSIGRWVPGRIEGVMLILLYAAYMLLWRIASLLV
jgi:hypothetical protein